MNYASRSGRFYIWIKSLYKKYFIYNSSFLILLVTKDLEGRYVQGTIMERTLEKYH